MNNNPNLCQWKRGDIICANRLNEMVCRINGFANADNAPTSLRTSLTGNGLNTYGTFNRQLCRMHNENGAAKVVDTFVASPSGDSSFRTGVYARNNSAISYNNNPCFVESECFKFITCVGEKKYIYQKITTDRTGVPTCIDIVAFDCDTKPTSTLWNYTSNSSSGIGTIYNPVSKIVRDCRVSCKNRIISHKYTAIKSNNFFIHPIPQNAEIDNVQLVKYLDGNTIPIKTLKAVDGTSIDSCENHVKIGSGVTFTAAAPSSSYSFPLTTNMAGPACVKWTDNFGFKVIPNQCKNPYKFAIMPFGTPGEGCSYNAGEGIGINGSCIYNKKANSANCTLGGVYNITTSSSFTQPAICNGNVILPDYAKRDEITPPTHSVVYSSSTPSPNNCGWVQTMLLCNVAMQIPTTTCYMPMYYRQLMRFNSNNLEVSYQYKTSEAGNWQRAPLPSMASLMTMTSL